MPGGYTTSGSSGRANEVRGCNAFRNDTASAARAVDSPCILARLLDVLCGCQGGAERGTARTEPSHPDSADTSPRRDDRGRGLRFQLWKTARSRTRSGIRDGSTATAKQRSRPVKYSSEWLRLGYGFHGCGSLQHSRFPGSGLPQ